MSGAGTVFVCLDVGSTNSRAWLVRDGEVVARETAGVGVRDSAREGSTTRVRAAVRDLVAAVSNGTTPSAVLAAGMITSPLGLVEVPHVVAPASIADLAQGAVVHHARDICAHAPIVLVPGVRTAVSTDEATDVDATMASDVMRGEETLVVGLLESGALAAGAALLNAGSHWKLIRLDAHARIGASRTSLGGELVHAVQTSTVLAASLPTGPLGHLHPEWLEAGAEAGRREGLLRALFTVRLLDQHHTASPDERLSWLIGACMAEDIDSFQRGDLIRHESTVHVSGPAAVPAAWVHLLRRAGYRAEAIDASKTERAFVDGLLAIAALRT
jgi:2-dehydro-3-deoxygalactonokinase